MSKVQGIWETEGTYYGDEVLLNYTGFREKVKQNPSGLEDFGGNGKYRAQEFTWFNITVPTAIKFLNTEKLGKQYQNDIVIGDYSKEYELSEGGYIAVGFFRQQRPGSWSRSTARSCARLQSLNVDVCRKWSVAGSRQNGMRNSARQPRSPRETATSHTASHSVVPYWLSLNQ